jgi:hypothetical protein
MYTTAALTPRSSEEALNALRLLLALTAAPAPPVKKRRKVLEATLPRGWKKQEHLARGVDLVGSERASRAADQELKRIATWLNNAADGKKEEIPFPEGAQLVLSAPDDRHRRRPVISLTPAGQLPLAQRYRGLLVFGLQGAAVQRCPRCRKLFALVRERGRPRRFCSDTCGNTTRTYRWRKDRRDDYLAGRRKIYAKKGEA